VIKLKVDTNLMHNVFNFKHWVVIKLKVDTNLMHNVFNFKHWVVIKLKVDTNLMHNVVNFSLFQRKELVCKGRVYEPWIRSRKTKHLLLTNVG
jgi:hypothetical protein